MTWLGVVNTKGKIKVCWDDDPVGLLFILVDGVFDFLIFDRKKKQKDRDQKKMRRDFFDDGRDQTTQT